MADTVVRVSREEDEGEGEEQRSQDLINKAAGLTGYVPDDVLEGLQIVDSLQKFLVYVYRRVNGSTEFVAKFQDRFPDVETDIAEKFGGGEYPCKLTWHDPLSKGKNKTALKNFTIRIGEHFNEIAREKAMEAKRGPAASEIMSTMTDTLGNLLKLVRPEPSGNNTEMFRLLLQSQKESEARMEKMLERLADREQKNPMEQMKEMFAMFAMMKEAMGLNQQVSTDAQPWWQFLVTTVAGQLENVYSIVNESNKLKQMSMAMANKDFPRIRQAFVRLQSDKEAQTKAIASLRAEVGNDPEQQKMLDQILVRCKVIAPKPETAKPVASVRERIKTRKAEKEAANA